MKKFKQFLANSWPVQAVVKLLSAIPVSKNLGISLYDTFSIFFKELKDKDLQSEANAVAFNFTLAIFPGLLFLFTLIPYLPIEEGQIMGFMRSQLPKEIFEAMESTIKELATNREGALLIIGVLLALFLSTNGVVGIIDAFNRMYHTKEKRKFLRKRLVALALTVIILAVFCFSVTLITVSKIYLKQLVIADYQKVLITTVEYMVVTILFFLTVSFIYYFAPTVHKRFKFFSLGSVIATILGMLATSLFFAYLNSPYATYNKVYGSIGTLIAVMIWIKFLSLDLLIGFEINASLHRFKRAQTILTKGVKKK